MKSLVPEYGLEHTARGYLLDFVFYGATSAALSAYLVIGQLEDAATHWTALAAMLVAGLLAWSVSEYLLHRFVLHGLRPFKTWHEAHHARPAALIGTPTVFSAALIFLIVFLPALLVFDIRRACAWTLGFLIGYFSYAVMHHAVHYWRANTAWLKRRKHWHAVHHHLGDRAIRCYGVTSGFWDRVFGTA